MLDEKTIAECWMLTRRPYCELGRGYRGRKGRGGAGGCLYHMVCGCVGRIRGALLSGACAAAIH
jgi:hypothetical protein